MSNLMLHAGAHAATEDEIFASPTPDPTSTWYPIPHGALVSAVRHSVESSGWAVERREYGLFHGGDRMFGVWAIQSLSVDYQLVIGLRNSHDKSFSAGLAVGSRVFVCDNLSFSGEITIARKHTRFIHRDLDRLVAQAVGRIGEARHLQDNRITAYKSRDLSSYEVHDFLIRSVDANVIPNASVPRVLGEYRTPQHDEFAPRTAWSLFNSYTEVLKATNPLDLSARTVRLHGLMDLIAPPSQN